MKGIIALVVLLLLSCTQKESKDEFFALGQSSVQYESFEEYISAKKSEALTDDPFIRFMFLNNPYSLDENNMVSIYINSYLVYRGEFKRHLELRGLKDKIFENESRMILSMEILTNKQEKVVWEHRFQSKTIFSWNPDYKMIYCGFFPTNEDVEKVYFIPHVEQNL